MTDSKFRPLVENMCAVKKLRWNNFFYKNLHTPSKMKLGIWTTGTRRDLNNIHIQLRCRVIKEKIPAKKITSNRQIEVSDLQNMGPRAPNLKC